MPLIRVLAGSSIITKATTLVLVAILVLVGAILLTTRELVSRRFASMEREDAKIQVQRVTSELDSALDKLRAFATDWAFWDDTYQFVSDGNDDFVTDNLMDETFVDQRVHLMAFADADGKVVYRKYYNPGNAVAAASYASIIESIERMRTRLFHGADISDVSSGILATPAGPLLLVSAPVLPSLRDQPARGWFLVGRLLDRSEIGHIGAVTHLRVDVTSWRPTEGAPGPAAGQIVTAVSADGGALTASTVLNDLAGQPALAVHVDLPRTVYLQGVAMWKQHALAIGLLSFCLVLILIFLLNRLILRKLVDMAGEVNSIAERGDSGRRITVRGQDEIGSLAAGINRMLESLAALQAAQANNERALKELLDTINCGVMVVDAERRTIEMINQAGAAMVHLSPEDIIGNTCHSFLCPRERNNCPVLDHGEQLDLRECTLLRADRSEVPILKSVTPLEREGRACLIESFVDISSLKKAEAELRASEARYRQFFEEDITGDFISTPDGTILYCNPAFARMLGYQDVAEILRTKMVDHYFSAEDRQNILDAINLQGRKERMNWKLRHRNDQPVYCVGNAIARYDTQGKVTEYQVYLFDETNRVLLEKEMRQKQKLEAIGTLAGGIAHDFNNILAGIIGFAELGLKKGGGENPAADYMRKILLACDKARELVWQILTFSRKTDTHARAVSLRSVVEEVLGLVRATLPATIAIETRLTAEAVVLADPVQIHQVVLNLCTNAGHAMGAAGGRLMIGLDEVVLDQTVLERPPDLAAGPYARLTVADTGHGIPAEILSRIFDPFFSTKGKDEGTGLGLSVVHGIIQGLQGGILVQSSPDTGSTFQVYVPLAGRAEEVRPLEARPVAGGREHIVYIDDDPVLTEVGRDILRDLGYRVTDFNDSIQALAYCSEHHGEIDLVVSDMTMPGLTGLALAKYLRQLNMQAPVIIYTGYRQDLDGEDLEGMGIREVLLKPVTADRLGAAVRRVLDGQ